MDLSQAELLLEHVGPWTEEEFLELPRTVWPRIELVDGALIMSPSAGRPHQRVAKRLTNVLDGAVAARGGEALEAANIRLEPGRIRIPDIVVFYTENDDAITNADEVWLVAEVLSPDQEDRDRVVKYEQYAKAGIPWYLIVNPLTRPLEVGLHQLTAGEYKQVASARAGELLYVPELEATFDPAVLLG